ncbi:MAG: NAD(P)/FAD-dependent oxidoreductase [Actinomycetota bacterium]
MPDRDAAADVAADVVDVVVIGAGLAGLTAARELERVGRRVTVVDKGRSVGGRLATRRIGEARFDHGAQFFTQRGPELAMFVEELRNADLVEEWCRGFNRSDGHPRYWVTGGMTALAKYLAGDLADVRTSVEVRSIHADELGWRIVAEGLLPANRTESAESTNERNRVEPIELFATAALITCPVPQTLALLDAGGVQLDSGMRPPLEDINYDPAYALMVLLDGPGAVGDPGAVQFSAAHPDPDNGPFSFVADNSVKGIAVPSALTLHSSPAWSTANWERPDDEVHAELLAAASRWFGGAAVVDSQLKRWRYAAPRTMWPERSCVAVDGDTPIVLAGDAFDGPRVEGAYVSGRSGATAVLRARTAARPPAGTNPSTSP